MRLFIFCTKKDTSIDLIKNEAVGVDVKVVYYEDMSMVDGQIIINGDMLDIILSDRIIVRWPWIITADLTYDYNIFVQIMVDKYSSQIIMDQKCLSRYSPFYEDKLFQSFVFNDVGISTPKTHFFTRIQNLGDILKFPVVAKRRISSRSKHNIKLSSNEDLEDWIKDKNIFDYIFQEYIEAELDVRVIVLFGKVIGSVKRDMHVREGNRLSVKGMEAYDLVDKKIESEILKVASYMGADLLGFDLLIAKDRKTYLIEANLSPLFVPFMEATGVNVGRLIVNEAVKSIV